MDLTKRYQNDPAFHSIVQMIYRLISKETGMSPLDIRDAAYLARQMYEMEHIRPITFDKTIFERDDTDYK